VNSLEVRLEAYLNVPLRSLEEWNGSERILICDRSVLL
jgi:hypothetical protein